MLYTRVSISLIVSLDVVYPCGLRQVILYEPGFKEPFTSALGRFNKQEALSFGSLS